MKKRNRRRTYAGNSSLLQELKDYERSGMELWLNGRPARPEKIVRACSVSEQSGYMRDLISDEKEQVKIIDFISVKE